MTKTETEGIKEVGKHMLLKVPEDIDRALEMTKVRAGLKNKKDTIFFIVRDWIETAKGKKLST